MDSICTNDAVIESQSVIHTNSNGFLAVVEMAESSNDFLFVKKICDDFHSSHLSHFGEVLHAFF
jgi:hypothetical protein